MPSPGVAPYGKHPPGFHPGPFEDTSSDDASGPAPIMSLAYHVPTASVPTSPRSRWDLLLYFIYLKPILSPPFHHRLESSRPNRSAIVNYPPTQLKNKIPISSPTRVPVRSMSAPPNPTVLVALAPAISPCRIFTREVRAEIRRYDSFRAGVLATRYRGRDRSMVGVSFYQHGVLAMELRVRRGDGKAEGKGEAFRRFGRLSIRRAEVETIE